MRIKKSKTIEAFIPTASTADIAFLLIIFFIVSTVYPVDKTQMELPSTEAIKQYKEDSAVISITTNKLAMVRSDISRSIEDIFGQEEEIMIKVSDGLSESNEIYRKSAMQWDLSDANQYDMLRNQVRDFIRKVERRRESSGEQVIIVIKADAKVPFYAVDGIVQTLQDLGGQAAQGIAIISKLEG